MIFPRRHLILGLLAAFIASAVPHSDVYAYQYDETVLETMQEHCTTGTGNTRFCSCMIDAIENDLPPQYAVLYTVSVGGGQQQFFKTSDDLPRFLEDRLSDRTTYCRWKYAHGRTPWARFNNGAQ